MRILFLDDFEAALTLYKMLLERMFGKYLKIDTIQKSDKTKIKELKKNIYDIVFLDWIIPGEEPGESANSIISELRYKESFIVSGHEKNYSEGIKKFLKKHNIQFLKKPLNMSTFEEIISRKIKNKKIS